MWVSVNMHVFEHVGVSHHKHGRMSMFDACMLEYYRYVFKLPGFEYIGE